MSDRKYSDDEVREIFGIAASGRDVSTRAPTPSAGITLADMQGIAKEVGLEPAHVARAAAMLDARPVALPRGRVLGMPTSVGRIIPLTRAPTDSEWEQIVTELRTTFAAKGKFSGQGGLREWSNGNLHAFIEPITGDSGTHVNVEPADGRYRLRLMTVKSNAMVVNVLGAAAIIGSWVGIASVAVGGISLPDLIGPAALGAAGAGAFISNMIRLPRWANERERQMDHIASKVATIVRD